MEIGDQIRVAKKQGIISKLMLPRTADAKDFNCWSSGGILIKFIDGDLQLWKGTDEDLILLKKQ